jgi:hypothetical protein
MMSRLKSRIARLEAVALPEGEPMELEVCFIKADGAVSNSMTITLGGSPGPIAPRRTQGVQQ